MRKHNSTVLCVGIFTFLTVLGAGCPKNFHSYYIGTIKYDMSRAQEPENQLINSIVEDAMSGDNFKSYKWRPGLFTFQHSKTGPFIFWNPKNDWIEIRGKSGKTELVEKIIASIKSNMRKRDIDFQESEEFVRKSFLAP